MKADVDAVLSAVTGAVDRKRLADALSRLGGTNEPSNVARAAASGPAATNALHLLVLSDILDDAILGARPGEASFPLRLFFGALGETLDNELTFALASGLNFFFRAPMEDEAKVAVGLEVSKLYYAFAESHPLDPNDQAQLSPLLARLLTTQLEKVRFESVDGAGAFDSKVHERASGSDRNRSRVSRPKSFLCRVVSNSMVRAKALVLT